ncbi:MAG: hypothetical protein AAFX51_16705, partial [Cyanobacteria bacterium J06636_28]
MKDIKHLGKLAPTVLRSLLIAVLVIAVAGVSTAAVGVGTQPPPIPSSASPPPQTDSRLIARALSGAYTIPAACSVPIIPALVTEDEIELRQYQVDFAKFIEEQAELDRQVNLTSQRDVLAIEKFRLDCEIMLTRAEHILQSNNIEPTSSGVMAMSNVVGSMLIDCNMCSARVSMISQSRRNFS